MSTNYFLRRILRSPKLPSTNIPEHLKDSVTGKLSDNSQMKFLWQYRKGSIKRRYATFGNDSGLKAGICWPSRDELAYMKEYEKNFEKSFADMQRALQEKNRIAVERRQKRETEVRENLAKLPAQKKIFWEQYNRVRNEVPEGISSEK